jgi:hypothetical protein
MPDSPAGARAAPLPNRFSDRGLTARGPVIPRTGPGKGDTGYIRSLVPRALVPRALVPRAEAGHDGAQCQRGSFRDREEQPGLETVSPLRGSTTKMTISRSDESVTWPRMHQDRPPTGSGRGTLRWRQCLWRPLGARLLSSCTTNVAKHHRLSSSAPSYAQLECRVAQVPLQRPEPGRRHRAVPPAPTPRGHP